jgi:hypothetical protein
LGASITVFADFKVATLPLVSVELLDAVASILGVIEYDNAGSLRAAVRAHVDVGANDIADLGWSEGKYGAN